MAEPDKADEFAAYFASDVHQRRLEESIVRNVDHLTEIGKSDILSAFSEAVGSAFAVAHFYRHLGLKHQGGRLFREIFFWMKKGVD